MTGPLTALEAERSRLLRQLAHLCDLRPGSICAIVRRRGSPGATRHPGGFQGRRGRLPVEGWASPLPDAISYIRDGGVHVSPLLRIAGLLPSSSEAHEDDPLAHLSRRERDVFFHLVNGLRTKEIANLLDINPKSVDTYRASLMRKLNIHDWVGG